MLNHLRTWAAFFAATMLVSGTTVCAQQIVPPPASVTGPTFGAPFTVDQLFDASVSSADLGVTAYGTEDGQWAGPGEGPHELFMDYGASVSVNGVAYSQRAGNDPVADKVGLIEFWFSDTDFADVFPATTADATATITNTTDTVLTAYDLGGVFSGQYVAARVTAASLDPPVNNPGGTELRLLAPVPEPASVLLLSLISIIGLGVLQRDRFRA